MVLAIKDEENKFDMLVRNCFAHDGKRGPIELVDRSGCITRPKLMSRFTKIKNFGSSATVLSYAHFQAFKFPDSMEVHFQCTIQICRHQCPEQCTGGPGGPPALAGPAGGEAYSESTISGTFNIQPNGGQAASAGGDSMHLRKFGAAAGSLSRERRSTDEQEDAHRHHQHHINSRRWLNGSHSLQLTSTTANNKPLTQNVGLNRVIQVVSTGDLAFAINKQQADAPLAQSLDEAQASQLTRLDLTGNQICMSSFNFVISLVVFALVLLCSSLLAVGLYVRQRSLLAATGGCSSQKAMQFAAAHQQQQRSSSTLNKLLVASQQQQTVNVHVPSKQIFAHNQLFDARQ